MSNAKVDLVDAFGCTLRSDAQEPLILIGRWRLRHFDKFGREKAIYEFPNLVTNTAKNSLFDTLFNQATQVASNSWYMGLISNSGYSSIQAADTMSSHAGWTEFTGYSETTRPLWTQGAAASQSVTNSTPVTFSINATGTVKGGFIATNNVKSGTTGLLFSAGLFTADVPVVNGDQIRGTYTVSA